MKVFIVDDSDILRERLLDLLSEIPEVEVIGQADNAREAINFIRSLKPDLVILDIRMPGGNGIYVLENIKMQIPSPLVMILTNYPYPQYRKKCLEAGADFFFDKSVDFERMLNVLSKLAQKWDSGWNGSCFC